MPREASVRCSPEKMIFYRFYRFLSRFQRMVLITLLLGAVVLFGRAEPITIPLSLANVVVRVNIPEPLRRDDRRSVAEGALRTHPHILNHLPLVCDHCAPGSRAHLDSWVDEVVWQVESALVRKELQHLNGRYWDIAGFWRGRGFSNEANRMILREVVAREPKYFRNASTVLREAMQSSGPPLAAAAHSLAQLFFDHGGNRIESRASTKDVANGTNNGGQISIEREEVSCPLGGGRKLLSSGEENAVRALCSSVLNVPGHMHRHRGLMTQRSNVATEGSDRNDPPPPQEGRDTVSADGKDEYGQKPWAKRVEEARVEIVVVATKHSAELEALQRSAAAFYQSDTPINMENKGHDAADFRPFRVRVLGLGKPWPGFGLKIALLHEFLEQLEHRRRQQLLRMQCNSMRDDVSSRSTSSCIVDDPLILFLDAFDVLLLEPFRHIKRRFLRQRAAVLFAAEIEAAPDSSARLLYHELLGTHTKSRYQGLIEYPYLNSGSVLGLASDMYVVLQDVLEDIEVNHAKALKYFSNTSLLGVDSPESGSYRASQDPFIMDIEDQRWFTRYFLRYGLLSVPTENNSSTFEVPSDVPKQMRQSQPPDGTDGNRTKDWRSFVSIDNFGRIFQTTHRSKPSDFRVGSACCGQKSSCRTIQAAGEMKVVTSCSGRQGLFGLPPSQESYTSEISEIGNECYVGTAAHTFAAGLVWNRRTCTTPCLLHGNDWKHVVFDALTTALGSEGWPPQPLLLANLSNSWSREDGQASSRHHRDAATSGVLRAEPGGRRCGTERRGGQDETDEFGSRLVVRWSDALNQKLHTWQKYHNVWLPNGECASTDPECMTSHLEVLAEQRLMLEELKEWGRGKLRHNIIGRSFPLLSMMTGQSNLYSGFYNDMLIRGVVAHDPTLNSGQPCSTIDEQGLAPSAIRLLRYAIAASRGHFAAASHTLAEIVFRYGGNGSGNVSLQDLDDAKLILGRSIFLGSTHQFNFVAGGVSHTAPVLAEATIDRSEASGVHQWCSQWQCKLPYWAKQKQSKSSVSATNIELVTVANHERAELRTLRKSAENLGYHLTVLGVGEPWPGLGQKAVKLHSFLRSKLAKSFAWVRTDAHCQASSSPNHGAPESCNRNVSSNVSKDWQFNTVILFLDAFDVLLLPTATRATLLRRFESFQRPVVFGAESVASPDTAIELVYPQKNLADSDHLATWSRLRAPFLNSGTIMGYAGAMLCMSEEVVNDMKRHHAFKGAPITDTNDQRWYTRYWLRHTSCAALDHGGLLFRTLHGLEEQDLVICQDKTGAVFTREGLSRLSTSSSSTSKDHQSADGIDNIFLCAQGVIDSVEDVGEAGGPCVLHGNGEDALFQHLSKLLGEAKLSNTAVELSRSSARPGWPWDVGWKRGGTLWKERDRVLSSALTGIRTKKKPDATEWPKALRVAPFSDLLASLEFDASYMKDTSHACEMMWTSLRASPEGKGDNRTGFIVANIMVNGENKTLTAHRSDSLFETASAFVGEYNLTSGSGCAAGDSEGGEVASQAGMRCVVEHLMLHMEREFFFRELESMNGDYFDFIRFYSRPKKTIGGGVPFSRFLDNVLINGVLRDRPSLMRNATRALRCAMRGCNNTKTDTPFAAVIYTLANILYRIGQAAINDGRGSHRNKMEPLLPKEESASAIFRDAATLLNASLYSRLPYRTTIDPTNPNGGEAEVACTDMLNRTNDGIFSVNGGVHIMTVATSRRPELLVLKKSVELAFGSRDALGKHPNGAWKFTVIGLGRRWNGLGCKVRWFASHLRCLLRHLSSTYHTKNANGTSTNAIVAFVDAYDVLATGGCHSAARLEAIFRSFNATIVFGAERDPAPDAVVSLLQYPDSFEGTSSDTHDPLPYLNAGCYIGEVWAIEAMLREVLLDLENNHLYGSAGSQESELALADIDDQRWFTRFFLRHGMDNHRTGEITAALDSNGLIFHSLHGLPGGVLSISNARSGVVRSRATGGTSPCFLHGNAGGREELRRVITELTRPGAWLAEE